MSKTYSTQTAVAIIIANMIGTGVFTSLGFQLLGIQSGFVILMLWLVGGVTALCGALTYAELGAALPRSGGEYNFLTHIYHPVAGFTSGWISSSIGFSAPTALASITFGKYLSSVYPALSETALAVSILLLMTFVHATKRSGSGGIQTVFTVLKIALIILFCIAGISLIEQPQNIDFLPTADNSTLIFSSVFATSLIYVSYAYSGWNAATYISSELKTPQKSLPLILLVGTGIVTICYLALNYTFLYTTPIESMVGKVEVGVIAAQSIFGTTGALIMGSVMSLLLVSTVSAMTIAGPRVLQVIGEDFRAFKFLAKTNNDGIPSRAIWFQSSLAFMFILTSSFESILIFSGFALALNNFFAVFGIFVLRWRQPNLERPYRTWLYPLPPILYVSITLWTLIFLLINRPYEAFASLGIVLLGVAFYFVSNYLNKRLA